MNITCSQCKNSLDESAFWISPGMELGHLVCMGCKESSRATSPPPSESTTGEYLQGTGHASAGNILKRTPAPKEPPLTTPGWEKEFDETFEVVGEKGTITAGDRWIHSETKPEEVKSFIRSLLSSQKQQILDVLENFDTSERPVKYVLADIKHAIKQL